MTLFSDLVRRITTACSHAALFIALLACSVAYSQVATYNYSTSIGTYSEITGGTVISAATWDDNNSTLQTIPAFVYNGTTVTKMTINSNGWIAIGGTAATITTTAYTALSSAITATGAAGVICPFGRDQQAGAAGEIRWETVGNETIIQWKNWTPFSAGGNLNYQIRLNHTNNTIQFVYGTMAQGTNTVSPQVGIKNGVAAGTIGNTMLNLTLKNIPTGTTCLSWEKAVRGRLNTETMLFSNTAPVASIPSGLTFTYTPQTGLASTWVNPVTTFTANTTWTITTSSATPAWTAPTNANRYNVQFRKSTDCTWTDFAGNPVTTNSASLTGLENGTTYHLRVQPFNITTGNTAGYSHITAGTVTANSDGYVAAGSFTTIPLPPAVTGFSPNQPLCSTGGQQVIVYGSSFIVGSIVRFNGVNATGIVINSATQITCVTPIGLNAGNITVQSVAGVSATSSANAYTTFIGPALSLSTGQSISPCGSFPTTVEVINDFDTANSTTFSWSPFNDGISADTGAVVVVGTTANQTYTVTATDSLGCTATVNLVVTPTAPATVILTPSIPFFCGEGGTTTIAISSDNANYEYTFEALELGEISNATSSSIDFTVAQTASLRVEAIDTTTQCQSEAFTSIGVYDFMQPTITATPSTTFEGPIYDLQAEFDSAQLIVESIPYFTLDAPSTANVLVNNGAAVVPLSGGSLDDGGWSDIPIGFTFNYFGNNFSTLSCGTNGTIIFGIVPGYGTGSGQLAQYAFSGNATTCSPAGPSNGRFFPNCNNPGNVIAFMAADNNPGTSNEGSIKYWTSGYAPNRIFHLKFSKIKFFGSTSTFTASMRLFESSGVIEIFIDEKQLSNSAVVGLQNANKTVGSVVVNRPTNPATNAVSNWIVTAGNGEAWRFTPVGVFHANWGPTNLIMNSPSGNELYTVSTNPLTETGTYNFSLVVTNNANGCSNSDNPAIVSITVEAPFDQSYLAGYAYFDTDCNGVYDGDDVHVAYPMLLQGDTVPVGSSNGIGSFYLVLDDNSTTTLALADIPFWENDTILSFTTADTAQAFENVVIGLCPSLNSNDLCVSMNSNGNPRPGFTRRYNIIASNLWPGSDSAVVQFNYALMPGASIVGYSPGGTNSGNTISFTTNLYYGQTQFFYVDVQVAANVPLGTIYQPYATIALLDANQIDYAPQNNTYTLHQTVIGSYDPNDKLVTPSTIDLLDMDSTATEWLEYTIRFQNTGTAEAIFVRVLDTLSQALDLTSFQFIAASHPTEIIFHDDHVIEWFFDNIMLPDSFSNEPGSHGFIQFRIRTQALSAPFNLENSASIYFDFNAPVITAPAVAQIIICSEAGSTCDDGNPCTANDLIQSDCTCVGISSLGVAPEVLYSDSDITIDCNDEIPAFSAAFTMPDGSAVSIEYSDSVLSQTGCHSDILQLATAFNVCGDSTVVSRTVTIEDLTPPAFGTCTPETTISCEVSVSALTMPMVSDNCSSNIVVSYNENCLDCNADSTVYPCATPIRPIDNPCNYPYDWSLALFSLPNDYRWYQVDTMVQATMTDYFNGTLTFRGRWVNAQDNSGGFDFAFTLEDGQSWLEWDGTSPAGFTADCGGLDENHEDWMYYLLQSGAGFELQGWGTYAGSMLNITHAPSNEYFGYQIGLGANSYNAQYGMGGWATVSGAILVNGEPITSGIDQGVCDIRFVLPSCAAHTSEVTWTATDCSGNSATCSQIVHFEPSFDQPECFVDNPCNDNDPCTIGDAYQADCSCAGSLLDANNDGVCDLSAPCEGVVVGDPCDDFDPCTMNDILQADCTCAGIYADADGDGVCDAEDNCDNTLAGSACDDGDACTVNDVIQADCVCAGTFADTDEDGVCDASEIAGCMDMEACNYTIDATDEDGSCTYVESLAIDGSAQATAGENVVYTYPGPALSTYAWSANPGTITAGQGTTQVSVVWESALSGIISVVETNSENCVGDTVMLAVSIEPSAVTAWSQEHLVVYPNPASDQINLIGNIPSGTPLFLYNSIGACVMTTPFASSIDVGHLPAGLYHVRIALANVRLEQSFVILR